MRSQRSYQPNPLVQTEKWYVVDATDQILGRLAARIAKVLKGKNLPVYAPQLSPLAHVIVINADKALLTGNKMQTKTYKWHTPYRTGLKEETASHLMARRPTEVIRRAIQGMVSKNTLGRQLMKSVRIYAGSEHPHEAQKPEPLKIATRRVRVQE